MTPDNQYIIGDDYRDPKHGCLAYIVAEVLTVLCCVFFSGCKTQQPIVTETNTNTLIEREQVDSLIKVAADRARAQLALECDSLGNVHIRELNTLQGERTRLEIALRAALEAANQQPKAQPNKPAKPAQNPIFLLDVDCKSDSLQLLVNKLRERIREIESSNHTETVEVKVVPPYYRNTSKGFWVLLAILILTIGWKIAKAYFKIQTGGMGSILSKLL